MASRKASIHFKPVTNVRFAVSHSERTDLSEPSYLLPKEHQLPTVVVDESLSEHELSARFIARQEAMSRQAKRAGASPFWEGVVVLSDTEAGKQAERLKVWKAAYEKETGHHVLHMSIHLDEGYVDAKGRPHYNPHAHVIVDRLDEKNRFIHLQRKQLSKVQDLTAAALQMQRGSTLAERGGKRGRAHIPHADYRELSDAERLQLGKQAEFYDGLLEGQKDRFSEKLAKKDVLIEQYMAERDALKATGLAKQADYQALKKQYEEAKEALNTAQQEATQAKEQVKAQAAAAQEQAQQLATLAEQYRAERDALKASGVAKQADYQALKQQYEAAKQEVAQAKAEATKAKGEVEQAKAQAAALQQQLQKAIEVANRNRDIGLSYKAKLEVAQEEAREAKEGQRLFHEELEQTTKELIEAEQKLYKLEKAKTQSIPMPIPEKPLIERIRESFETLLEWIKAKGGGFRELNPDGHYIGPIERMNELHAAMRVSQNDYVILRLDELSRSVSMESTVEEIQFRDGHGYVKPQREQGIDFGR